MEAEAIDGYLTCDNELSPEGEHASMAIDLTSSTPNGQQASPSHMTSTPAVQSLLLLSQPDGQVARMESEEAVILVLQGSHQ
ncbi:hypothetical protein U0070_022180 [Myodes glareolus]|uniref:Uncharacterized protein n=1 Tax=Myodes glareolus TaxID=447135 RepID=A0AAW0IQ90_MYOGA